jgi:hypothetical protein
MHSTWRSPSVDSLSVNFGCRLPGSVFAVIRVAIDSEYRFSPRTAASKADMTSSGGSFFVRMPENRIRKAWAMTQSGTLHSNSTQAIFGWRGRTSDTTSMKLC